MYTKPRYTHDCDSCTYVGQWQEYDLYYCGEPTNTVIARYGNDGPNYASNSIDYPETCPKSLETWVTNPPMYVDGKNPVRPCEPHEIPSHCIALRIAHLIVLRNQEEK